jgi:general L-amino acid transport system permease protein
MGFAAAEIRPARPAPLLVRPGPWSWLRTQFFSSPGNTIITIVLLGVLFLVVPDFLRWALLDAVFLAPDPAVCRAAEGACWAVIREKHRVMLFGTFPYGEHWRGALASAIIVALFLVSAFPRFWRRAMLVVWAAGLTAAVILLSGGVFGLTPIATNRWGGLPLTLMLFVVTLIGGIPLGILLALGRRSTLPVVRAVCVLVIELFRGLPLITVLFMASLMLPLFLPTGVTVDTIIRAMIGMIIFFGAYAAEVIRGGLQAIPRGQYEAADALGLKYWASHRTIILPQALRIVIPPMINEIIRAFKNTSFVSIIGMFDLLGATRAALSDPSWIAYAVEAYLFIFALYFVVCYALSTYSAWVERRLARGRNL